MAEEQVVQEVVEEVVETANTGAGKAALVIGGILIGFGAGYFFAKRQLETKYNKIAEAEIAEMRAHYLAKERATEEKKPPIDELMSDLGYKTKLEGPDETVYIKVEPEDESQLSDWDYDAELANRSTDVPYVIHKDEYFNNETPFEQMTLTYYEGDDILADSNDTPVDDQDAMVGLGNLSRFGHGSGDPNVVYVRNHELQLEIEIVHSDGKFAEEVHGFSDDELKHSDRRHQRRRKYDDDD